MKFIRKIPSTILGGRCLTSVIVCGWCLPPPPHARTHARTRTYARTRAHTHARTHSSVFSFLLVSTPPAPCFPFLILHLLFLPNIAQYISFRLILLNPISTRGGGAYMPPTPSSFFIRTPTNLIFLVWLSVTFPKIYLWTFSRRKQIGGRACDPWWRHRSCDPNFEIFDFFLNIYNWPIVGKGMENVTNWDQNELRSSSRLLFMTICRKWSTYYCILWTLFQIDMYFLLLLSSPSNYIILLMLNIISDQICRFLWPFVRRWAGLPHFDPWGAPKWAKYWRQQKEFLFKIFIRC